MSQQYHNAEEVAMNEESFAFYRYPYADEYVVMRQRDGEPCSLESYSDLDGKHGFVFAPFSITGECPLLLLSPDVVEHRPVPADVDFVETPFVSRDIKAERRRYGDDFAKFHSRLSSGAFGKIVLSRRSEERQLSALDVERLFVRACRLYPRMFIALVSTRRGGTWLMSTPEILVESKDGRLHTMSVAGTMEIGAEDTDDSLMERKRASDISEWSRKNIKEQQYVSRYITDCLQGLSFDVSVEGPYTLRAGMVKHLASDFFFSLKPGCNIGDVISTLHPTPAVCGMPKAETYDFILANESSKRAYYSGFAGPLNCDEGTHLYVTLRCMEIGDGYCRLYAGGGLLSDSVEENEWLETEAKMETMRRCLAIKRI